MTTVATDGTTIAADGLTTTQWGLMLSEAYPKVRLEGDRVYAISGAYAAFGHLISWYAAGANPAALPITSETEQWVLLVRDKGAWVVLSKAMPYPHPVTLPFAIGAGADMAIGAMEAGASPLYAVKIVCRRTIVSGGKIESLII